MDNEARKDAIRQRLLRSRYPRRGEAKFTAENDHNPMVLQDCPHCHGSGKRCYSDPSRQCEVLAVCDVCDGSGTTGNVEPYFANNEAEVPIEVDAKGWLTCPHCGWTFTIRDPRAWTGARHLRCGQKIRPVLPTT